MAHLYFIDLAITAEPETLRAIESRVDAEVLWCATEELAPSTRDEAGERLRYSYGTKSLEHSAEGVAAISSAFPDAAFAMRFENPIHSSAGMIRYCAGARTGDRY